MVERRAQADGERAEGVDLAGGRRGKRVADHEARRLELA
jgi:hypothetical protein